MLGGLLAGSRPEFHPGGVEIAVDGFRRDAQPKGDLFAAVALDNIAKAVPLTVGEEIRFRSRLVSRFPHEASVAPWRRLTSPLLQCIVMQRRR